MDATVDDFVKFSLDNCLDDLFVLFSGLSLEFPFFIHFILPENLLWSNFG